MIVRLAAGFAVAVCAALPCAASARATASLDGGTIVFFADTLGLVARNGATLRFADGTRAAGDAAYVDLKNDRIVVAGHARVMRGEASANADAVALDLDGDRVDLLDLASGVSRTTRTLATRTPDAIDAQRFAFPDVEDGAAFIRSRHATISPHADVRFTPASFPTSVGGVPVPSYLYTFATGAGFGTTALQGATFDQPYGLFGTRTSLTALHAQWLDGTGAALGLQQQIVGGDRSYLTAAVDAPFRGATTRGFNAYTRMGDRYTATVDGSSDIFGRRAHAGIGAAFGNAGGRLDFSAASGGFSTFDAKLRSPDLPLIGGATLRLSTGIGYDALKDGYLTNLPDRTRWSTVWRHGVDLFLATPVVRGPFRTSIATSFDASRTWYAFPHRLDQFTGTATASRELSRRFTVLAGYQESWSAQVYPTAQRVFYVPSTTPLIAPDGTPWYGYNAFDGAAVSRAANLDLQFTPNLDTTLRLSLRRYDDFLQFDGIGRPLWEVHADARFRPFPNIGVALGRSYDFGWGGTRWIPRWTFAITP